MNITAEDRRLAHEFYYTTTSVHQREWIANGEYAVLAVLDIKENVKKLAELFARVRVDCGLNVLREAHRSSRERFRALERERDAALDHCRVVEERLAAAQEALQAAQDAQDAQEALQAAQDDQGDTHIHKIK